MESKIYYKICDFFCVILKNTGTDCKMIENAFTLKSPADGLDLSCMAISPENGITGIVQFVHGMCEHKERYFPFMEFLASNGYACVIHDHRGHGASVRTSEDLGFMYDGGWEAMVGDVKALTDWALEQWPGLRLALFGHSMGSMVVRSYAKRFDDAIDTLFVCGSPSDNPAKGAGKFLAKAFGTVCGWHCRPALLQKMSFGAYNKPFADEGYSSAWVCSDPQVLETYHNDPLCQYVFTANGFYNLLGLMQDCYDPYGWKLSRPDLPVHFISGALDPCRGTDEALRSAADLMKSIGYRTVTLKTYPGMRHEILNETGKQTVWSDILSAL